MKKRKILSICLAAVTCLVLLSGCGKTAADEQSVKKLASVSDFSGETIDFFNGSAIDARLRKIIPDFETKWVGDNSAGIEDVKAGKAAAYMTDLPLAKYAVSMNPELAVFPQLAFTEDYAWCFPKGSEYLDKFNNAFAELKANGRIDEIDKYWIESGDPEKTLEPQKSNGENGTITIGGCADSEPIIYMNGEGQLLGRDIAICNEICDMLGYKAEYVNVSWDSIAESITSGRIDLMCGTISVTDERSRVMDFSNTTYSGGAAFVVRKDRIAGEAYSDANAAVSNTSAEKQSFFEKLKASFTRTFITENRWKLVLNGLGVTLIISISAFILGSLWGCAVCAGLRSKKKLANIPARIYVRLLQGTPIVVLLMILYYIVFKSFDISAIIVAIIGFALNLGAYTSEIFRTAIDSVDKGQIEAASAIGFSKFKVFSKIVFPQAAKNALPVYKGEFISLVKSTSIVGYITIQDLTKASDIIRSRTYEAFFPLIATAVIYFLVTYIFILILNAIEKKIDPKRRKRTLKGVELQ